MRAPAQESIGTAGQSLVSSQFERIGWGPVPNGYHDLGTDLVIFPRDIDRYDLGLPIGAQVKTSLNATPQSKYFSEPIRDASGEVTGWWYRESARDHFDYWLSNSLPHLIILVDLDESKSYWAYVDEPAVKWTSKGAKIFVPRDQTVDREHFEALTAVAVSGSRGPSWEGSAWTELITAPSEARLRYALLTPRLIAPHPNSSPDSIEPAQAIAMLVQCRFGELDDQRELAEKIRGMKQSPYKSPDQARASSNIEWQFYAALHTYINEGRLDDFAHLLDRPASPHIRAAINATYAALLIEKGEPLAGLACLDATNTFREELSGVDRAWLDVQRARCLRELGQQDTAHRISIGLQTLPKTTRADPTAMAITASAAIQIFTAAPWFSGEVGNAIKTTDTAAAWWRSQVVAWGLGDMLESSFSSWSRQEDRPSSLERGVFRRLRTASLLSGFSGDHSGWQESRAQLAMYGLQATTRTSNADAIAGLLWDLRLCGHSDELTSAARRIASDGPSVAAKEVVSRIDLDTSTVTTSFGDIRLITTLADILDQEQADKIAKWSLKTVRNSRPFVTRVRPSYVVETYLLQMLSKVMPLCSTSARRQAIQHLVKLPPVSDVALATDYARVITATDIGDWTPKSLRDLALRRGDDAPLAGAIEATLSKYDPAVRKKLIASAARGSAQALASLGTVPELPPRVVKAQVNRARREIQGQITAAQSRAWSRGAFGPPARTLTVMNIWHPKLADWKPIVDLLNEPAANPDDCRSAVQLISGNADRIPAYIRPQLVDALEHVRTRQPLFHFADRHHALVQLAIAAIDAIAPGRVTERELWQLMSGGPAERRTLARIVGAKFEQSHFDILASLAHDRHLNVRCEAARWLCRWLLAGVGVDRSRTLIEVLVNDVGTQVALVVADELADNQDNADARGLVQRLENHISGAVRLRCKAT